MRLFLISAIFLTASCAGADHPGPYVTTLSGQLVTKTYPTRAGVVPGFVIVLDKPVHLGGRSYSEIKVSEENDSLQAYLANNVSKRVSATCHVSKGTLWTHDSALCITNDIRVEP